MNKTTIECPCGEVELELSGDPSAMFYCHCDDCQEVHGAAYVPEALYRAVAVKLVRGRTISWKRQRTPRITCASCGTRMYADLPDFGLCGVTGSLLPKGQFTPAFHIYCRFALAPVMDRIPHYKDLPTRFGGSGETMDW